jgi:hypothetical protein
MQNTQHSIQIYGDAIDLPTRIKNLQSIEAGMFVPISPNINWTNTSNWPRTRYHFRPHFPHVHLSAVSSEIGKNEYYFNKQLVGGAAILTLGMWASKVHSSFSDPSGFGSFTIITIQGKGHKNVSFILAYIAVKKAWILELSHYMPNNTPYTNATV